MYGEQLAALCDERKFRESIGILARLIFAQIRRQRAQDRDVEFVRDRAQLQAARLVRVHLPQKQIDRCACSFRRYFVEQPLKLFQPLIH